MKVLIKEQRLNNIIEKYILELYPVVKSVTFIKKDVYIAGGDKNGRKIVRKDIIVIGLISSQLTHSPNWTMRDIGRDVNRMFSLDIDESGSDWGIEYKMI
jgi:hypothetical protein